MAELEGPDASIEISLKEYGIAWKIEETETRFYYGTGHNGAEYIHFDWADLENNLDLKEEYGWADLKAICQFVGMDLEEWEKTPLVGKIQDLYSYHGAENVFGESNTKPMTYEEVIRGE
jgi:hypothetical protein